MWRRYACLWLVLAAGVSPHQTGGAVDGTPRALVRSDSWDFGYLLQKSEVSHVFYLCNVGSAPLPVTEIKPGCSCTSVSEVERPIAPGDSVAVVVTFKSGRYHGRVKKTTKVHTDDPETPVQRLHILARVVKPEEPTGNISVAPRKLVWRERDIRDAVVADTLKIANHTEDSAMVAMPHVAAGVISETSRPPAVAPEGEIAIPLRLSETFDWETEQGLSVTFTVVGRDTTIVTVPIEIKD